MIPDADQIIGILVVAGLGSVSWYLRSLVRRVDKFEDILAEHVAGMESKSAGIDTRVRVIEERCHMAHGFAPMTRTTGAGWDGVDRRNGRQWSPGDDQ